VVGPSGAGKDTVLAIARDKCCADASIVFPRRIITRSSSPAESNDTVTEAEFERLVASESVALWWRAHGLGYALPLSVDHDIYVGHTVVCNVSRTIVDLARTRYARVSVVLITAPTDVLAERLARRDREPANAIEARLRRSESLGETSRADFTIENTDTADSAASRLVEIFYERCDNGPE
jgi:ribose 1,5-bisphosphokinase